RACLQHSAKDRLLTHQVRLHFCNERTLQAAGTMSAGCRSIGLRNLQSVAVRIVLRMDSKQGRYAESTLVLFAYLGAGALGSHHNDGEVFTDLHALFNDVEAVAVGKSCALLH